MHCTLAKRQEVAGAVATLTLSGKLFSLFGKLFSLLLARFSYLQAFLVQLEYIAGQEAGLKHHSKLGGGNILSLQAGRRQEELLINRAEGIQLCSNSKTQVAAGNILSFVPPSRDFKLTYIPHNQPGFKCKKAFRLNSREWSELPRCTDGTGWDLFCSVLPRNWENCLQAFEVVTRLCPLMPGCTRCSGRSWNPFDAQLSSPTAASKLIKWLQIICEISFLLLIFLHPPIRHWASDCWMKWKWIFKPWHRKRTGCRMDVDQGIQKHSELAMWFGFGYRL